MISKKLPHVFYGADYNPEQWPEEVWAEDVRLMREAGVNLVSVGIFAWAKLEPHPGEYDFAWLDRVLDLLHENGVLANLATATASPPPWMAKLYPDTLPVTREGVTLRPGSRQQYCPSSSVYRQRAAALVRRIAERYEDHPALAMWHVNNEYGCHVPECYCRTSAAAFREWLRSKYGTLAELNRAWGTAFWSQQYSDWEEVGPPLPTPTFPNPTQQLDWRRFSSDALLECFRMEAGILREITPEIPITTNFMGLFKPLDYWEWARHEDVVSHDCYPDPADPDAPAGAAMTYDLMRSLGGGNPWVLMEQTPSSVNWRPVNVPKRPGQMRLWSYAALARGADGIMFFQWRASKAGAEKFHGALVPHAGTDSRVWREVVQLGNELKRLDALPGSRGEAEAAILLDWESWWALELGSKPSCEVRLLEQLRSYYTPLWHKNILVDFAHPEGDLSRYRAVFVPNLYLLRETAARNLERFVSGGGTLVISFFSGIADGHDHIWLGGYPAPLRKLLGLRVEEFAPSTPDEEILLRTESGDTRAAHLWSDVIRLEGAEPVATFASGFSSGQPAITRHRFGRGTAYYLGTQPEEAYMASLLEGICQEAGVRPPLEAPAGVEVVRRTAGERSFLFALNHSEEPVELRLEDPARDLLTGERRDTLQLAPRGIAILEEG
ncbi:beta-galactosidase [Rubrobacter taiwanensis]|jgi:beta-galactosidase|uniref:Beta-galactosidase n=1 Tax=Rubrobacter taiwanensis TaxID=185139 RepID=A0A4V2NWN5_9ACTN|nr:beta-galactosidase [Rubrobacter taiwanensis]TCJ18062.1 beta-galactosidase [Rubrobacter taiwanensis]